MKRLVWWNAGQTRQSQNSCVRDDAVVGNTATCRLRNRSEAVDASQLNGGKSTPFIARKCPCVLRTLLVLSGLSKLHARMKTAPTCPSLFAKPVCGNRNRPEIVVSLLADLPEQRATVPKIPHRLPFANECWIEDYRTNVLEMREKPVGRVHDLVTYCWYNSTANALRH